MAAVFPECLPQLIYVWIDIRDDEVCLWYRRGFPIFQSLQGGQSGSQSCRSELETVYVQKTPDQIFSTTRTFTYHSLSPRLSGDKEKRCKSYYGRGKEVT